MLAVGATVERMEIETRRGDWLVFHVVNNRLRWGGARYFGVAGCLAPNEFGFVTRADSSDWSACDDPREADRFIAQRDWLRHRPVHTVDKPWPEGTAAIRGYAGEGWNGEPIWGSAASTWIKIVVN